MTASFNKVSKHGATRYYEVGGRGGGVDFFLKSNDLTPSRGEQNMKSDKKRHKKYKTCFEVGG